MPNMPTIMGLHMRYRLWIAEMNYYINLLRILEDYLAELDPQTNSAGIKEDMDGFKTRFVKLRKEIDDLRHEMHILKMILAAYAREGKAITQETYKADNHEALEKRFVALQASFNTLKEDFAGFEGKWPVNAQASYQS